MRAETGPMQFPDDWPGVFIRGDEAMGRAGYLEWGIATLERMVAEGHIGRSPYIAGMRGLLTTLRSCHVKSGECPPECQQAVLARPQDEDRFAVCSAHAVAYDPDVAPCPQCCIPQEVTSASQA